MHGWSIYRIMFRKWIEDKNVAIETYCAWVCVYNSCVCYNFILRGDKISLT